MRNRAMVPKQRIWDTFFWCNLSVHIMNTAVKPQGIFPPTQKPWFYSWAYMLKHNKGCLLIDLKGAHRVAFPLCSLVLVENAKVVEDFLVCVSRHLFKSERGKDFLLPKRRHYSMHVCQAAVLLPWNTNFNFSELICVMTLHLFTWF